LSSQGLIAGDLHRTTGIFGLIAWDAQETPFLRPVNAVERLRCMVKVVDR